MQSNYSKVKDLSQTFVKVCSKLCGENDKIQESPDCPDEDAIKDDDILDGWFIHSRRQREKEKKKAELESKMSNVKSRGADETFIMVNDEEGMSAEDIYDFNDGDARGIIRQRSQAIAKGKPLEFTDLPDVQQQGRLQAKEAIKSKTGRTV